MAEVNPLILTILSHGNYLHISDIVRQIFTKGFAVQYEIKQTLDAMESQHIIERKDIGIHKGFYRIKSGLKKRESL